MSVQATSGMEIIGGHSMMNRSGLPDEVIRDDASMNEIASKLSRWIDNARSASSRTTLFDRGAYTPPDNVYDEMKASRGAVKNDDIVGGVYDTTEAFSFKHVEWEGPDPDEADVFNQISRDLNLDDVIRKMWRETFTYSQYVAAAIWDWRTYKVRGETESGNRRKKEYRVYTPVKIAMLDPMKVVPLGSGPFGPQLLGWSSTNNEIRYMKSARRGDVVDPLMAQFFIGTYNPDIEEKAELSQLGVDTNNLMVMNPSLVWRHTATKPDYERFPTLKMKSVFKQLDLKQQLINADRAQLIGAANYILLIRKGSDERPGTEKEIKNLKKNFNFVARMPVIISDHRLDVDIIAPKNDFTLIRDRYDMIDLRLLLRLLGTLTIGSQGQRNETTVTLSQAVARNLENQRHMMKRDLEENVARAIYFHPRNTGVFEEGEEPNLQFTPRNIELELDAASIQAMLKLRQSKEISRETILDYFGLDQEIEAQRRATEEKMFDDIFQTIVPHGTEEQGTPDQTGRDGGRPSGGGESTDNSTEPKQKTKQGNTSTNDG